MGISLINAATATLTANAAGSGQAVYVDPITPSGLATGNLFVDMGYFPEGSRITPTFDLTRADLRAAGRNSGASLLLSSTVTAATITYSVSVLTPDSYVKALHAGASPVISAETGIVGVTGAAINPEAAIIARFILVKRRVGGPHTVIWHPRVQITADGTEDGDVNNEVYKFLVTVQAYTYTPATGIDDLASAISQYGAQFEVPDDGKLEALLTLLQTEAQP